MNNSRDQETNFFTADIFLVLVFCQGLYPRYDIPKMELAQCLTDAQAEFPSIRDSQRYFAL